jgi:hypothetical protein
MTITADNATFLAATIRRTMNAAACRAIVTALPAEDAKTVFLAYLDPDTDSVVDEEPKAAPKPVRQPGTPKRAKPTGEDIDNVLDVVRRVPGVTARDIASASYMGCPVSLVSAALLRLVKSREVVKTGRSYTAVTVARAPEPNGAAHDEATA